MKKVILILFITIFLIGLTSAIIESLGTHKQNEDVELLQGGSNFTFCNITSVRYPNLTFIPAMENIQMTQDVIEYNYTLSKNYTESLGEYRVIGFCSNGTTDITWGYPFYITETGDTFNNSQAIMLLGMFGLVALFFGIGVAFEKERWKLRSFFFLCSLLMGLLFLNSIRIVIGTSTNLAQMGSMGLVLGIVILSFMFLYTFISYTIEVFNYFKAKRRMKWDISER